MSNYGNYNTAEVTAAFQAKAKSFGRRWNTSGWEAMGLGSEGTAEALILRSQPVVAKWVAGNDPNAELSGYSTQEMWIVVEIEGQFFKKSGYYSSEEGVVWDGDVKEVFPQTKTVTVYE